jgi:hypothetical protein
MHTAAVPDAQQVCHVARREAVAQQALVERRAEERLVPAQAVHLAEGHLESR